MHAPWKSIPDTGNSSCKGPTTLVSLECSGNSQEVSYLNVTTALRARYNYPHSPDEAPEAQRGLFKVTEGVHVRARILTLLLSKVTRGHCPQNSHGRDRMGGKQIRCSVSALGPPGWLCDLRCYILCWACIFSAPVDQQCHGPAMPIRSLPSG